MPSAAADVCTTPTFAFLWRAALRGEPTGESRLVRGEARGEPRGSGCCCLLLLDLSFCWSEPHVRSPSAAAGLAAGLLAADLVASWLGDWLEGLGATGAARGVLGDDPPTSARGGKKLA